MHAMPIAMGMFVSLQNAKQLTAADERRKTTDRRMTIVMAVLQSFSFSHSGERERERERRKKLSPLERYLIISGGNVDMKRYSVLIAK